MRHTAPCTEHRAQSTPTLHRPDDCHLKHEASWHHCTFAGILISMLDAEGCSTAHPPNQRVLKLLGGAMQQHLQYTHDAVHFLVVQVHYTSSCRKHALCRAVQGAVHLQYSCMHHMQATAAWACDVGRGITAALSLFLALPHTFHTASSLFSHTLLW